MIDVAPTVLQAIGPARAKVVNGDGCRWPGTNLLYSFDDAKAKERPHRSTSDRQQPRDLPRLLVRARSTKAPWEAKPPAAAGQLGLAAVRHAQRQPIGNDLAKQQPKKLRRAAGAVLKEAAKYGVLPMDDRVFERLDGAAVGRPT